MKPIGFSPSFCLEICKFWTFRSLAFFFRAFRLLEVLAGAAAYQLEVGDSSEPLRMFETHYNFSWWGNVVVWNWYQNSELGDCQGLIHKPFMMGLPASVNSCFYSSSIGLLFRNRGIWTAYSNNLKLLSVVAMPMSPFKSYHAFAKSAADAPGGKCTGGA